MSDQEAYKLAYERERLARIKAETLLNEKTRDLYNNNQALQTTIEELRSAQLQLIHSEKMASVGQLAAGVAHEINNPVAFSLSNISTLQDYVASLISLDEWWCARLAKPLEPALVAEYQQLRTRHDIDYISADIKTLLVDTTNGLHRALDIVANLKRVSHRGTVEMEDSNIQQVIEDAIKVVWNQLKYSMEIKRDFSPTPLVTCNKSEMHQVLINMFINAAYACETNGVLSIKTELSNSMGKQWVKISVSDNGKGMSTEVLNKIFDPFFTTKPIGVGTGLGLPISFAIIEKHGGKIEVLSEEGKGSDFLIYLPVQPD